MAIDAFLWFSTPGPGGVDIEGETLDKDMKEQFKPPPFDISTWNCGLTQDVNVGSGSGGMGAGKVTFNPFKITKAIDKSSPLFLQTCCSGGHYDEVHLMVRKSGTDKKRSGGIFLQFSFKMAFVTNISWSHNDPSPTEDIEFEYGAMQVMYKMQKRDGSLADEKKTEWSRVLNKKDFKVE